MISPPSGRVARRCERRGGDASGPLSFMDVWDAMCRTIMSAGSRRGAMMATMRCDHPRYRAVHHRQIRPGRLRMFNMSVLVTDAFMEAVQGRWGSWDLHLSTARSITRSGARSVEQDHAGDL